jgi:hypothetical protein
VNVGRDQHQRRGNRGGDGGKSNLVAHIFDDYL